MRPASLSIPRDAFCSALALGRIGPNWGTPEDHHRFRRSFVFSEVPMEQKGRASVVRFFYFVAVGSLRKSRRYQEIVSAPLVLSRV
jgi:hypothetical protein